MQWAGKGPPSQSLAGGGGGKEAAKAWCGPLVLLLEIHFTHHVSALSLSCQIRLMFEAHWQMKAFPSPTCSARGGGGGAVRSGGCFGLEVSAKGLLKAQASYVVQSLKAARVYGRVFANQEPRRESP